MGLVVWGVTYLTEACLADKKYFRFLPFEVVLLIWLVYPRGGEMLAHRCHLFGYFLLYLFVFRV
jgi:hypothetical protein